MKDACSATAFRQWTLRGRLDVASAATGSSRRRRMKECFHVSRKTSSAGESLGNQFRKPEKTLCGGFQRLEWGAQSRHWHHHDAISNNQHGSRCALHTRRASQQSLLLPRP
jgi:hypothetical protein